MSYELRIDGDLVDADWDATWEERIDGVGTASVNVQNRDSNPAIVYGRQRNTIGMQVNGLNAYQGEVTRARLELPPGRPYPRWQLTCTDYNALLDTRLVGAADGYYWQTFDGGRTHRVRDEFAWGLQYDDTTVQNLFSHFVRAPARDGGFAFGTSTFVFRYIPRDVLYDPVETISRLHWTNTTVRAALDELRGLAGFPVFYWIDPDNEVHWQAFPIQVLQPAVTIWPGPIPHQFDAPAAVTGEEGSPNGTTIIGGRGLFMEFDGTYMPERAYVVGVTDFIYNGGSTIFQGTGWRNSAARDNDMRQIIVDAQATTKAQRNAVAEHYQRYGDRARLKGSVTVGGRPDEQVDGWRCGQMLTIIDDRLPTILNGLSWPIQRVSGKLVRGQPDLVTYTLEFGDAPVGRFSDKYLETPQEFKQKRLPANNHVIHMPHAMRPSSDYNITSRMVDHSGKPIRQAGVPVRWSLVVRNSAGGTVGTGSLSGIDSVTDRDGGASATLTTGAATGLHYHVKCVTSEQ